LARGPFEESLERSRRAETKAYRNRRTLTRGHVENEEPVPSLTEPPMSLVPITSVATNVLITKTLQNIDNAFSEVDGMSEIPDRRVSADEVEGLPEYLQDQVRIAIDQNRGEPVEISALKRSLKDDIVAYVEAADRSPIDGRITFEEINEFSGRDAAAVALTQTFIELTKHRL
jgi:hypothetical protein